MFKIFRRQSTWGGRALTLETGKVARNAAGAVMVTYGETTVLCTVSVARRADASLDFLPLVVHYQEKAFAVGKIPGGFFKRETKPSEKETLTSRLIDRMIRPQFPKDFHHEVQVICTVLSYDGDADPAIAAMVGTSAALMLSGVPFDGPVAGTRIGYKDEEFVINPSMEMLEGSRLDLVVAGTREGILMVESGAKELDETTMLTALERGHESLGPIITLIDGLVSDAGKKSFHVPAGADIANDLVQQISDLCKERFENVMKGADADERKRALDALSVDAGKELEERGVEAPLFHRAFQKTWRQYLRRYALDQKKRLDGRGPEDIRQISCETGMLKRVHGSALFTRGQTQALVVATLGNEGQMIDSLDGVSWETFLLHYNFPPYSVGETGRLGPPGRRELGHGRLAWRALQAVLPDPDSFPYVVRMVSEITESNGSSSMATVCGSSLALMDAGVPLKAPVAGIAMGLIREGEDFVVLSDILGDEDNLGDMDFKVAGTEKGITALQMDIKGGALSPKVMKIALKQAQKGRLHILKEMARALSTPREQLSLYAPRFTRVRIPIDRIKDLIGPGGKTIREMCESTGAKIEIEKDGLVKIFSQDGRTAHDVIARIKLAIGVPEVGDLFTGTVVKVADFGAFVNFAGSQDGLVHVSEIGPNRVERVADVLKVGDVVKVKVIGFDGKGRIKLSIKQAAITQPEDDVSTSDES